MNDPTKLGVQLDPFHRVDFEWDSTNQHNEMVQFGPYVVSISVLFESMTHDTINLLIEREGFEETRIFERILIEDLPSGNLLIVAPPMVNKEGHVQMKHFGLMEEIDGLI